MNNMSLRTTLTSIAILSLLIAGVGFTATRQAAPFTDDTDGGNTIIVCTTDNEFHRFPAHQWRKNTEGDIEGVALKYSSLEAAKQGTVRAEIHPVTVPSERVANLIESESTLTTGATIAVIVHGLIAIYLLIGAILWSWRALRDHGAGDSHSGRSLGNRLPKSLFPHGDVGFRYHKSLGLRSRHP